MYIKIFARNFRFLKGTGFLQR